MFDGLTFLQKYNKAKSIKRLPQSNGEVLVYKYKDEVYRLTETREC